MTFTYDIPSIIATDEYLTDPLLMALAWKRTHDYVRNYNWYADNFELDESSLFLYERCREWSRELKRHQIELKALELVPAPKPAEWGFFCGGSLASEGEYDSQKPPASNELVWQPVPESNLSLRPLAHIGIKEQTYFTLLMSSLANIVETKQGDPSAPFDEVHERGVFSYGNRLYCAYDEEGNAEHNYGAATVYSKFFTDYRTFLKRPYYFCHQYSTRVLPDEDIYIVELDLEKFYDNINRDRLVEKVEQLIKKQIKNNKEGNNKYQVAKNLLEAFKTWKWDDTAVQEYKKLCLKEPEEDASPPNGIPQGLVAGGFLANIYLLEVDQEIGRLINEVDSQTEGQKYLYDEFKSLGIRLIDYCRYVDDIRLVISVSKKGLIDQETQKIHIENLQDILHALLAKYLEKKSLNLIPNVEKTNLVLYRGIPRGISTQLNEIQERVSGPLIPEQVDHLINELEALLVLSRGESASKKCSLASVNRLAEIERDTFDLAEGTIRRFAANKLAVQLREKRHFTAREVGTFGEAIPGEWDYLQERIARRLIAVWSRDPSQVLLLKRGLELFPSPNLLRPVLEQMDLILGKPLKDTEKRRLKQQKGIIRYCLAEVFRHSATVIHKKDPHAIPAHANAPDYFEMLQNKAAELIKSEPDSKEWLLVKQARFLLLVRLDTVLESPIGNSKQDLIFKLIKGFRKIDVSNKSKEDIALCILLADQLTKKKPALLRSACEVLISFGDSAHKVLHIIATQNVELAHKIIFKLRQRGFNCGLEDIRKKTYFDVRPSTAPLELITYQQSLAQLFLHPENPFANEIMAIRLMKALISKIEECLPNLRQKINNNLINGLLDKQIDLSETIIQIEGGYSVPPKYGCFDKQLIITQCSLQDGLSQDWLALKSVKDGSDLEPLILRKIAIVIRAALASNLDGTGFGLGVSSREGYRGVRTTRAKREIGLYTTPESLAGEGAQVSGWLTTLLTRLLRWPGIRVNEQGYKWPRNLTIDAVKKLLKKRLSRLRADYCQQSQMPILTELISPQWSDKKSLNVVMVQSKIPAQADFTQDLYLNGDQYRAKHRRHIATVAELTLQYIRAQRVGGASAQENEYQADLIVWPELAVHHEDLDILKQLSQKTHAIIFAGLVFIENPDNTPINTALWIVPRKHNGNENEIMRLQGKQHMTVGENKLGIRPWRPYQLMLELRHPDFPHQPGFKLTGAICLDATDINLSADLTNKSNAFIVAAMNRDVNTFDSMVEALHYHMYQHVVLVNTGEFGGSYAMAPYKERHEKLIAHNSGKQQVAISSFEMNMFDFRRDGVGRGHCSGMRVKTAPAGVRFFE